MTTEATATMRALQVTAHGPPGQVLAVRAVAVPEPGAGEVRIRVGAASLNFNDIDRCRGRLVSVPTPPPFTLGMDACGVVDAAGPGAEDWVGRRVVAVTTQALGGVAEWALAPAVSTFDAPDGLDDAEAAAFVLAFQASHLALFERGRLTAGETLVVQAAASGLGTAAVQLARARGARVVAVVGGPAKADLVAGLGADVVVDHTAEDVVEAVLAATGDRGADVVYDLAGGSMVEPSWRCTARGGRYVAMGFADDEANGMTGRPLRMACIANIDIVAVMFAWVEEVDPGMRRFGFNPFGRDTAERIHGDLLDLVGTGAVRPVVGKRVSMEAAGAALDEHEARRSLGRTVVEVAPGP